MKQNKIIVTLTLLLLSTSSAMAAVFTGQITNSTQIDYFNFDVYQIGEVKIDVLAFEDLGTDHFGNGIDNDVLDSGLILFAGTAATGTFLGYNDDSSTVPSEGGADGSTSHLDSLLRLNLAIGSYTIAIGRYDITEASARAGINLNTPITSKGGNYQITVTGQGSLTAVPVPGAVWLMGSGFLGLMGFSRKKYKSLTAA